MTGKKLGAFIFQTLNFLCLFVVFVFTPYYYFFFISPRIMLQDSWGHSDILCCILFVQPGLIRYICYKNYISMYL